MTIRVYQWASGTVGCHTARAALERDSLELVGMHVYSPTKVGKDIGELIGTAATGRNATDNIEAVIESDADVVIHTPLPSKVYGENPDQDIDDFCELLAAGKNVITVVGYMYPKVYGDALVKRLQDACKQGNSSFHSSGLNPGWMGDLVPLTMSALCERIDHAHVLEISNFEFYPSPEIMFEAMGFNSKPEDFKRSSARRNDWLTGLFSESVHMTADGMGLGITEVVSTQKLAIAEQDLQTAAGTVRKGTVAGQHWRWAGLADGEERMVHETVWRMHNTVAPEWAQGDVSITFKGSPDMHIEFPADFGFMTDSLLATAMHAVNAIPYVVEAAPGIQTFLDLPWIMCKQ